MVGTMMFITFRDSKLSLTNYLLEKGTKSF